MFKTSFLGITKFGGHKKLAGHCSRIPPVVMGLYGMCFVSNVFFRTSHSWESLEPIFPAIYNLTALLAGEVAVQIHDEL